MSKVSVAVRDEMSREMWRKVSAVMVGSWAQGVLRQVTMPTWLLSGRRRDSYFFWIERLDEEGEVDEAVGELIFDCIGVACKEFTRNARMFPF